MKYTGIENSSNDLLHIFMPCFKIGDRVYHKGRKMNAEIVSLLKEPDPKGTPCGGDMWCDVKFEDGVIWISQDKSFDIKKNGNDTIVLINEA